VLFRSCSAMAERGQEDCGLILIKLQEGFFVAISISLLGGLVLGFPYISYQMWRFVAPGLYKNEKGAFLPFLVASPLMFLLGASFAHFVVTPLAMAFFLGFADVSSIFAAILGGAVGGDVPADVNVATGGLDAAVADDSVRITFFGKVNESLDITLKMILAFGLCFQLPVLLTLMGKAGLVSTEGLRNVRKYAVVGILLLAALVTPPDVVTQLILFVVVYGLYEISIFLVSRVEAKREARLRAEGYYDDEDDLLAEFDDEDADDEDDLK